LGLPDGEPFAAQGHEEEQVPEWNRARDERRHWIRHVDKNHQKDQKKEHGDRRAQDALPSTA